MPVSEPTFLYITADSPEDAAKLGRILVEERLAACVNIIGGVSSIYWWDGEVREGAETALVAKTRSDLAARVADRIKEMHGYACPCVVALPLIGGNSEFLEWIVAETSAPEGGQEGTPQE